VLRRRSAHILTRYGTRLLCVLHHLPAAAPLMAAAGTLVLLLLLLVAPTGVAASGEDHEAMEQSQPPPLPTATCGAYGPAQNQTDITGGKILFGLKPHVVTPSAVACCGRCFSEAPTADAWVREDGTGYCWCVQGATGTKPRPSRSCGRRAPPPIPSIPGPLPPPAVLDACEAAVTLDPRGTTRQGGHFERATLAANSVAADCAAMCCSNWNCAAFSFEVSTHSCSLKPANLSLANNSHSTGVVSGFLGKLAAPDPPFNESTKFHSNVSFADAMSYGTEGDTWPTTWLKDNTQLTAAGDRGDMLPKSHMSMWRVGKYTSSHSWTNQALEWLGSIKRQNVF
jgi:hypothetical protein